MSTAHTVGSPFNGHIETAEQLAVDGWAVTFGTFAPGQAAALPSPLLAVPNVTAPSVNGQCTDFILFDVAL